MEKKVKYILYFKLPNLGMLSMFAQYARPDRNNTNEPLIWSIHVTAAAFLLLKNFKLPQLGYFVAGQ